VEQRSILLSEYLLLNGAQVNLQIPELNNGTVLYRAVRGNDIGMVSLLLKRRSCLEMKDNDGQSPIDLAQECEDAYVLTTLR
jgi:ankyrin repeat protein